MSKRHRRRKEASIRGFVLDEQIDARAVDAVRAAGFIAGQPGYDPACIGVPPKQTSDPALLAWAVKHRMCFITKDLGFARAGRIPSRHWGVVVLRCESKRDALLAREIAMGSRRPEIGSALRNWRLAFDGETLLNIAPDGAAYATYGE